MISFFQYYLVVVSFGLMLSINVASAADFYINPDYITSGHVQAQAVPLVTYDAVTGLYTYNYTFRNDLTSLLEIDEVKIPLNGSSAINVVMPRGWTKYVWQEEAWAQLGATLVMAATETPLPPDYVDDGSIPSSPFQIKPGQVLGGFSFQSPDPPVSGNFYAEGFTQLPRLGIDVPEEYEELGLTPPSPFDPSESYKGIVQVPQGPIRSLGGGGTKYVIVDPLASRDPSMDGFLAFTNIANGNIKFAPLTIDIRFAINGESVDQSTFKAYLNSEDITAEFKTVDALTRRAVIQPEHLDLNIDAWNILLTTVKGTIPRVNNAAWDVDRVTFRVQ